jgi:hypothetical protein
VNITKNTENNRFFLEDIIGIVGINYTIDLNTHYEYQSNLLIHFKTNNNGNLKVKFYNITDFNLKYIGGPFNYLSSIQISKNISYEKEHRYHVDDYENGMIGFYCETYEEIIDKND